MPGDGLTFAVRIGCEVDGVCILHCLGDSIDMSGVAVYDLILHGEVLLGIDRASLGHEVAHMAIGGKHLKILAQILLQGLGLGG